jgi:hypothetical protein
MYGFDIIRNLHGRSMWLIVNIMQIYCFFRINKDLEVNKLSIPTKVNKRSLLVILSGHSWLPMQQNFDFQ